MFFFFKQKTAYEMRISDWSSDVCSSDLCVRRARPRRQPGIDRRAARRIDDDEKGDQRRDEQFGQCGDAHPSASVSYATPSRRHAETRVLRIRHAIVIGPTPPGTGVIAPAWLAEPSKSRSEEHTSELPSLMRISHAVFCLKQNK